MTNDDFTGSTRLRNIPGVVLAGIVFSYCAFNWMTSRLPERKDDLFEAFLIGVMVFEPTSFAMWCALGPGSLVTRSLVVGPCVLLLFVVPGIDRQIYADTQWIEFIATLVAAFVICVVTTILFLLLRRFGKCRIELTNDSAAEQRSGVRFSTKYLLGLITLAAMSIGMYRILTFGKAPQWSIFGPQFYINVIMFGGAAAYLLALPTTTAPLLVLLKRLSRRALITAFVSWAVVTLLAVELEAKIDEGDRWETLKLVGALQLGALVAGILVAVALRVVGYRIIERTPLIAAAEPY